MLRSISIGMSIGEVICIAEKNNGWTIQHINENSGVGLHATLLIPVGSPLGFNDPIIGEQSIRLHLGTYRNIVRVHVGAFLAFDENSELIEIFIRKERDLP